jgi:2-methylcitrate dehydratase PrpD
MRGWHLTGTAGTFAAAATANVMLGLDGHDRQRFGLAGTQSAGLWRLQQTGDY